MKGEFTQKENQKRPASNIVQEKTHRDEIFPPSKGKTKAIAVIPELPRAVASIDEMLESFREYLKIKEKLKAEGDIVEIRGKEFSTKSFVDKLGKFFSVSCEIVRLSREIDKRDGSVIFYTWVKAIAPSGRFFVAGAAASSRERSFTHIPHDIMALSEVRARKRAIEGLLGFGSIPSLEEEEEKEFTS